MADGNRTVEEKTGKGPAAKKGQQKAEFLVLGVGNDPRPGNSLRMLGSAPTLAKAKELVEAIDRPSPARVAIVEKKGFFERRPQVVITPIEEDIVGNQKPRSTGR